ncbi:Aquaporin-9 [Caenorhabditis elegans]|uniref:Aquaporin-9 n=2 Tax=Caenorhabditis elegans TaxID=6239 RepID=A0A6V7QYI0_CAEEL|nr:Aquaporin-9 [Caenorhabditis elegans]CAD1857028.1 Aquaporin-9 [Caenorhabditis elegans]
MSPPGVAINIRMAAELERTEQVRAKIQIKNPLLRNALSEFFGTFLLLFIGIGIVMQFILSNEKLNTWININLGWGLAIAFTVYTCSKTSGGHFNPAVSIAFLTLGKLPFKDFLVYCVVQTIGAALGSAAAFGLYYDQFVKFAGAYRTILGPKATAGCFCSYPALHVSNTTAFFDQFAGTALLVLFVCVVIDKRNGIPGAAHPLLFGLVVMMIGTAYGMNLGYPINPARDLGPRLFSFFIYGSGVFSYHSYYFWIPVIAPLFGAIFGAWSYTFFVGAHIPDQRETTYVLVDEANQPLKLATDA